MPLAFVPRSITNMAMLTYVLALLACNILYMRYALTWYWWAFGLVEACGFFYFANYCTKRWARLSPKMFAKRLFVTALSIRVVYVLFSYWFYLTMTGSPFEFDPGDVGFYNEMGRYGASLLRDGHWNLFPAFVAYSGADYSDLGYPLYLSFVYLLSGDSILVARLVKAIWSAWTALLIYKLAVRNFGESTGRIAGVLCMLMPNLIYYCGLHLKEIEMVFLAVLFAERADYILRRGKLTFGPTCALMLIAGAVFTFRTALAAVLVLAFLCALLLSSTRVVGWKRRILLVAVAALVVGVVMLNNTSIGNSVRSMWETRGSEQKGNMEWRATRVDSQGRVQKFAKYAGAAVFAPMIFTIPFPTMTETPGQENLKMIHGGNFVKNITSFFTILALFILLFTGDWRKNVLPIAILCGYLLVLIFSSFAQSERFHLPSVPFAMMFAAYGISYMRNPKYKRWFNIWCVVMFVAALAWNWFKLAGRGML